MKLGFASWESGLRANTVEHFRSFRLGLRHDNGKALSSDASNLTKAVSCFSPGSQEPWGAAGFCTVLSVSLFGVCLMCTATSLSLPCILVCEVVGTIWAHI